VKVDTPNESLQRNVIEPLNERDGGLSKVTAILDTLASVDQHDAEADKGAASGDISRLSSGLPMVTTFSSKSRASSNAFSEC